MTAAWRLAVGEALTTLRASPTRTLLSVSGVLVGFTTLTAILAYAGGFESLLLREQSRARDPGLIVVTPVTTEHIDGLVLPATRIMRLDVAHVDSLTALLGEGGTLALRVEDIMRVDVQGVGVPRPMQVLRVSPGFFDVAPVVRVAGALDASGGLVNEAALARLGLTPAEALGREVRFGGNSALVVGVISDSRPGEPSTLLVPLPALSDLEPDSPPPSLLIRVTDTTATPATLSNIRRWVETVFWPRAATVATVGPSYARSLGQFRIAKVGIGALAGIAIVSGVIGIMNIMFAAVLERTREIGIRRACGARRRDIHFQFLSEAIAIALGGAALGMLIGVGAATLIILIARRAIEGAPPFSASLSPLVALGLLAVAALAGAIAGWYPAARAARLAPAEAIRVE